LFSADNIPRKQNHTRRLDPLQQGSQAGRHLRPIEADDKKLPNPTGVAGGPSFVYLRAFCGYRFPLWGLCTPLWLNLFFELR
jgi:hypothetical protein